MLHYNRSDQALHWKLAGRCSDGAAGPSRVFNITEFTMWCCVAVRLPRPICDWQLQHDADKEANSYTELSFGRRAGLQWKPATTTAPFQLCRRASHSQRMELLQSIYHKEKHCAIYLPAPSGVMVPSLTARGYPVSWKWRSAWLLPPEPSKYLRPHSTLPSVRFIQRFSWRSHTSHRQPLARRIKTRHSQANQETTTKKFLSFPYNSFFNTPKTSPQ